MTRKSIHGPFQFEAKKAATGTAYAVKDENGDTITAPSIPEDKALLVFASPRMFEALESAPVIRTDETLDEFRTRYWAWSMDVRTPALAEALGVGLAGR